MKRILFVCLFLTLLGLGTPSFAQKVVHKKQIERYYTLYFRLNQSHIDLNYKGNGVTIQRMVDDITSTLEIQGALPEKLHIEAATSPEGSAAVNQKLALKRGQTSLGEFSIGSNRITVSKVAKTFNTIRGAANPDSYIEGVTFVASEGGLVQQEKADRKDLEIGDDCYYWVAMNYLLVPSSQEATVTVDAEFVTSGGKVSHSIDNVPIRKNYRTNIIGELFTAQGKFKVKVNPIFDGEYNHSDSAE